MEVEIRPGIITRDATTGQCTCRPLRSKIVSLLAEQNQLQFAVPGGLIGVGTLVDPALCRADRLLGMVMSAVGKGPNIYTEIKAEGELSVFQLLSRVYALVAVLSLPKFFCSAYVPTNSFPSQLNIKTYPISPHHTRNPADAISSIPPPTSTRCQDGRREKSQSLQTRRR